jgi:hypothetical protein
MPLPADCVRDGVLDAAGSTIATDSSIVGIDGLNIRESPQVTQSPARG